MLQEFWSLHLVLFHYHETVTHGKPVLQIKRVFNVSLQHLLEIFSTPIYKYLAIYGANYTRPA
jgi:hypothetical protein